MLFHEGRISPYLSKSNIILNNSHSSDENKIAEFEAGKCIRLLRRVAEVYYNAVTISNRSNRGSNPASKFGSAVVGIA